MKQSFINPSILLTDDARDGLLAGDAAAYSKTQTPLGTTAGNHFAAIGGRHSFTEAMLIYSLSVRRLKCSFHCRMLIFVCIFTIRSANLLFFFILRNCSRHFRKFSLFFVPLHPQKYHFNSL